jgi:excisionase family DNA binding protein
MKDKKQDEFLTIKEISDELQIPERTLLYYKQQGDFPDVYRFGKKHRRVKKSDFEAWKAQKLVRDFTEVGPDELESF